MDAFTRVLKIVKTQAALAQLIGITPQAVSKWQGKVPDGQTALKVAAATGWEVTPHELRPDIYPLPIDGLPADDLRRCAVIPGQGELALNHAAGAA